MPIQHSVWKVGERPIALAPSSLRDEKLLEEMIEANPSILAEEWMIIGRQVQTSYGGYIDLLAIAPDASLVVIELKRHRTPREVVAQTLDYGSWVQDLDANQISNIYEKYSNGESLSNDFKSKFGSVLQEEELNRSHQLIVVAAEVDTSTERIIKYLSDRDITINALLFEVFESGSEQFLVRRWFVDPAVIQSTTTAKNEREPWNGEYFVSFGDDSTRNWQEAVEYGFISAGGGLWYSRTLGMLDINDRIWVRVPGQGYVGVGEVIERMAPIRDMKVNINGVEKSFLDIAKNGTYGKDQDEEGQEYCVRIKWLKTVSVEDAYDELGFFGNQNTVCRPTAVGWRNTVDKLKIHFKVK